MHAETRSQLTATATIQSVISRISRDYLERTAVCGLLRVAILVGPVSVTVWPNFEALSLPRKFRFVEARGQ